MEMLHLMSGTEKHIDGGASKMDLDRGLIAEVVAAAEPNPFISQIDQLVNIHSVITGEKDVKKDPRNSVEAIGCDAFQDTLTQKVKPIVKLKHILHSKLEKLRESLYK